MAEQIRKLLEDIAENLAPSYGGKLYVGEYKPLYPGFLPLDEPFLYIAEEREVVKHWETRRFLGLMKKKMRKKETKLKIIAAFYTFEKEGGNKLGIVLADHKSEGIFRAYLIRNAEQYNIGRVSFHLMH
ncbi:MAG: hypothetical protein KJ955_02355 [Nanoarchaeota archaeon]|nr:hypothetical protein [Nanoarchaeota archaeon]